MYMKSHPQAKPRGDSLIEVLVAILVSAVGVLGLAKMQALTIANTQVSGLRGLIALQASSLASSMHSNKGYWQNPLAPVCTSGICVLTGTTPPASLGAVPSTCLNANLCTPGQMAAWDLNIWMNQMNNIAAGYTTTVNCTGTPSVCSIEIVWNEKQAGGGATANIAATTPTIPQAYYLYVQP